MDATARPLPAGLRATGALLGAGVLAGPLYVAVGLAEAALREGFDLARHPLSLLANGDGGWVHMTMMVAAGLLAVAGAAGLRRTAGHPAAGATAVLLGIYGLGVAASGLLVPDPAWGFPPGTPDAAPEETSAAGIGHFVAGGIGFAALIVACLLAARRFAARGEAGDRGWAVASLVVGAGFLVAFAGVASTTPGPVTNIGFGIAVVAAWAWIAALCLDAVRGAAPASAPR